MNPAWKWWIPGHLWALPATLFGLLMTIVWYRPHSWRLSDGCIEVLSRRIENNGKWAGVTYGSLIVYGAECHRGLSTVRRHERGHVVQFMWLGPLMMPAYAIAFFWAWARGGDHSDNFFERTPMAAETCILPSWGDD